jgi:hypothetical protein
MGREDGTPWRKLQKVSNRLPLVIVVGLVLVLEIFKGAKVEDEDENDYEGEIAL